MLNMLRVFDHKAIVILALILCATLSGRPQNSGAYETAILPVIQQTCAQCHNETVASGGLNLKAMDRDSLGSQRAVWETVLRKLKAGEMPPPGTSKPPGLAAMAVAIENEFDRLDRNVRPDPGRITARRLNRTEYRNTIRDLTGVEFQATQEFPADDTGEGFDNIAEVLTTSPLLAEKYLAAAERISARALGLVRLPKPINVSYSADIGGGPLTGSNGVAHRTGNSFIEVAHRVEYDGDYVIQAGLAGQRGIDTKPVTMGFWMDGVLLHSEEVATTPPKSVYFSPYELKEFKLFLPEGPHVFRLGFINDEIGAGFPRGNAFDSKLNKFPQYIGFLGPERSGEEPAGRKMIVTCDPASGAACVERILSNLARRAYRRPVKPSEIASLVKLVDAARSEGLSAEEGIQTALTAVLVAPDFLFRIERDSEPANAAAVHRVSDVELASRLSYFLWSSTPDDALLDLAEKGRLSDPSVLDVQVKRMLADPRSSALSENFAGQWLETRNLDSIRPDPQKFPEWNAELKEAMRAETRLFFDSMLRENRPISEFLTARYTFLNERLARFYGIEGVVGPAFRRVDLPNAQRGGILSQASVLAVTSYPTRTSVVLRGKYILENVLASPPPPPPPNVPPLDDDPTSAARSLRQQMEQHRANPSCAICHSKIDPLGFALENYDAIGKWRATDVNLPVDAAGILPDGTRFNGPSEFREALAGRLPQFAEALSRKMLVYALGRGLESYDRRAVGAIERNWEANGYAFQSLIFEVVHSLPFQSRRGES
jgi:mono/diheme cytochrome c family protein